MNDKLKEIIENELEKLKRKKDKKNIDKIGNSLLKSIENILGPNSELKINISERDNSFGLSIYNNEDPNIRLHLSFHYPRKFTCSNMENKLKYAKIDDIVISPKNQGYGSKIVEELIRSIKDLDSIELVFLTPSGDKARDFWLKNGFKDSDEPINCYDVFKPIMIYKIKKKTL